MDVGYEKLSVRSKKYILVLTSTFTLYWIQNKIILLSPNPFISVTEAYVGIDGSRCNEMVQKRKFHTYIMIIQSSELFMIVTSTTFSIY